MGWADGSVHQYSKRVFGLRIKLMQIESDRCIVSVSEYYSGMNFEKGGVGGVFIHLGHGF